MITGADILAKAKTRLGDAYVFGALTPVGAPDPRVFDCSKLASWAVYQAAKLIYGADNDAGNPREVYGGTIYWNRDARSTWVHRLPRGSRGLAGGRGPEAGHRFPVRPYRHLRRPGGDRGGAFHRGGGHRLHPARPALGSGDSGARGASTPGCSPISRLRLPPGPFTASLPPDARPDGAAPPGGPESVARASRVFGGGWGLWTRDGAGRGRVSRFPRLAGGRWRGRPGHA